MKYITISREYGSGGHSIGMEAAKKLGIEFYDREILIKTAEESGYELKYLEEAAENISTGEDILDKIQPVLSHNHKADLFEIQKDIILDFASKGSCVIVGRCAGRILEEAGKSCLKVFIYADRIYRAIELSRRLNLKNAAEIAKIMDKTDRERKAYYQRFSGQHWGDYSNYDLMLNSGELGPEKCVEIICKAFARE